MAYELTIMGPDGIRRNYDEHFVTAKDVEEDPVAAHYAIQEQHIYIYQLTESLQDMVAAFAGGGVKESGSDRVSAINRACAVLDKAEPSRADIEVDFTDEELLTYMKMAHEQDITFNQLVEQALRRFLDEEESADSLESDLD